MMKDKTVAGKPIGLDHPDGSGKVYVEIIFLSSIKGCAAWFDSPARPVRDEQGFLYLQRLPVRDDVGTLQMRCTCYTADGARAVIVG